MMAQMRAQEIAAPPEEDPFKALYEGKYFIDISGAPLDKHMAIECITAEIKYLNTMGVYLKIRLETYMKMISTKGIEPSKGHQ